MEPTKEELTAELVKVKDTLTEICNKEIDEKNPVYNYVMNGLMFIDEATRILQNQTPLSRKWLHYYADRCDI